MFSSVRSLSRVWLFVTPWTAARQASLSITNSQGLLKPMPIESVMPSNHLILCHPLLLPPSVFPSIRVFWNESVLHIRWPKCWSFSFSISPSNEHLGLSSFLLLLPLFFPSIRFFSRICFIFWEDNCFTMLHWFQDGSKPSQCRTMFLHQRPAMSALCSGEKHLDRWENLPRASPVSLIQLSIVEIVSMFPFSRCK